MRGLVVTGLLAILAAGPAKATVFLSEDFDGMTTDADLVMAGWQMIDTATAVEASTWTITNPLGRVNPPTFDGTPTTGNFLISDSDYGGYSYSNPIDTGASHDLYLPSFNAPSAGPVWLHMDVSAQLNAYGSAIFAIDVWDGNVAPQGDWVNVKQWVAPGRVVNEGATTIPPTNSNADGYYGRLDLDLSSFAAGQSDVAIRVRHYEPTYDYWIALDNVMVDDVAPRQGGLLVYNEHFTGEPNPRGEMMVDGLLGVRTWGTDDLGGRYIPGTVGPQNVNRIGHPDTDLGAAIIDNFGIGYTVDDYLMTPLLDFSDKGMVYIQFDSEGCTPYELHEEDRAMEVLLMQDKPGESGAGVPDKDDTVIKVLFDYTAALHEPNTDPHFATRLLAVPEASGLSDVFFAWHYAGTDDQYWAVDNIMVTANPFVPGDADGDGDVNAADARLLAEHWLQAVTGPFQGDLNGDGFVDDLDASIMAANWNGGSESVGVPEPGMMALLLGLALFAVPAVRRQRG
ncbi:MAG: dockerin type I repeat-containing protein [Pirellulales bacterium]|nr:dockerin type I repeat-containing protein [Pirellulales bacterium]